MYKMNLHAFTFFFIITLLLTFISLSWSRRSLEYSYDDLIRDYDTKVLKDGRIIIDAAITEKELATLMKVINNEPKLSKQKNLTSVDEGGNIFYATVVDLPPLIKLNYQYIRNQNQNHINSQDKNTLLKSSTDYLSISLMVRVLTQAEAFFNRSLFLKSASVFARRKTIINNRDFSSPDTLNHAAGFLVPIHTDGCNLSFNTIDSIWQCEPNTTPQSIRYYKGKDISIVIFLNELSDDGGGEFVFVDPIKESNTIQADENKNENEKEKKVKDEESTDADFETAEEGDGSQDRNLIAESRERSSKCKRSKLTANDIPPPPRHLIRQSLSHSTRKHHDVTKSVSVVAE